MHAAVLVALEPGETLDELVLPHVGNYKDQFDYYDTEASYDLKIIHTSDGRDVSTCGADEVKRLKYSPFAVITNTGCDREDDRDSAYDRMVTEDENGNAVLKTSFVQRFPKGTWFTIVDVHI